MEGGKDEDDLLPLVGRSRSRLQTAAAPKDATFTAATEGPMQGWRRNSTPAPTGVSRRQTCNLTPGQMEQLEDLHFQHLRENNSIPDIDSIPKRQDLDSHWGRGQGWQVRSMTPASEKPMNERGLRLLPYSKEDGQSVLDRFGIGAVCTKGNKANDTGVGQDSFSITHLPGTVFSGTWEVAVVADGHGPDAHLIADSVVESLPYFLGSIQCRRDLMHLKGQEALQASFKKAEGILKELSLLPIAGSTASCIVQSYKTQQVWVATLGDTRVIAFNKAGEVLKRTVDHTPLLPAERQRIEEAGGECRSGDEYEGMRVFIKDRPFPALAMTRTFGDSMSKKIGVTAVPEILHWDFTGREDVYIFAASDGVWEFMDEATVATYVAELLQSGSTPGQAAHNLLEKARVEWKENEDNYTDDICIVLLPVKRVGANAPKALEGRCFPCTKCAIM